MKSGSSLEDVKSRGRIKSFFLEIQICRLPLKQKNVIVLDNASSNSKLLNLQPTSTWKKKDIRNWLDNHKINYPTDALKSEMLLAK
ncbi:hypothetical protein ILUMI_24381 [Ignelater luminosus]|uniref:Transposase n=1 Tax=Ignelater luminosus TaxID=2038154 RepID=A0A8K0CAK8_IGNLU|nr:hypothetical protein ILUMI_24381 [Ignelater luminosus]